MRQITLPDIEKQVRELAAHIDAPDFVLPTFGYSEDGARPHIEIDPAGRMHYVVVERGQESERLTFIELDALLYRIFETVTFQMSGDFELKHRELPRIRAASCSRSKSSFSKFCHRPGPSAKPRGMRKYWSGIRFATRPGRAVPAAAFILL